MAQQSRSTSSLVSRIGLATGALAAGGWAAAQAYNRRRRRHLHHPESLPPAVDAPLQSMSLPEGRAQYYYRDGQGTPLVFLHSINAAGSTHELSPLFEHFSRTTDRPLYALDWLGFGQSDRPDLRYHPAIYVRQLQLFLQTSVGAPADLVALSLGGEYAASVAASRPDAVRRLALIAPTGCALNEGPSAVGQFLVRASDRLNLFETFYYQLTRESSLRRFYRKQVFPKGISIPDPLVRYAVTTTHIRGACYAPRYFVSNDLFLGASSRRAYRRLRQPTLMVVPEGSDERLVQSFERLPSLVAENPDALQILALGRGLLPHWETPDALFNRLDAFLS